MKKLFGILSVIALLAVPGLTPAWADEAGGTLQVSGVGVISARPDMAVIRLGVREEAKEASAASAMVARKMRAILDDLRAAGIAEKDIQTTQLSLAPRFDYSKSNAPRRVGFEAATSIAVTVRDLSGLGAVLDRVVTVGANTFNGVSFDVSNRAALMDQARAKAVADAMHKARGLAEAAGLHLGRVLSLSESGAGRGPQPAFARMAMEASADMPIAAGEMEIAAQVAMQFEISN